MTLLKYLCQKKKETIETKPLQELGLPTKLLKVVQVHCYQSLLKNSEQAADINLGT